MIAISNEHHNLTENLDFITNPQKSKKKTNEQTSNSRHQQHTIL